MGAKGEALAKQFEAKAQEAETVLEKLRMRTGRSDRTEVVRRRDSTSPGGLV